MNGITLQTLIAVTVLMSGCAYAPTKPAWPLPPKDLIEYPETSPGGDTALARAETYTAGLLKVITDNATSRGELNWGTGDFVSIGALMAVGGAVAGQPGLMNSGAGMSLLGLSASDRYQFGIQQSAYNAARKSASCVIARIHSISEDELLWAGSQQTDIELRTAATDIPIDIVESANQIKESLIIRLQSIESVPLDVGAIKRLLAQVKADNEAADKSSQKISERAELDGRALLAAPLAFDAPEGDKAARKFELDRIQKSNERVPLELQASVTKKLMTFESELSACVVGL